MTLEEILTGTKIVDLFCGIGGLTHGLQQVGIDVEAGYDIDASCRYAYEKNNRATFYQKDIGKLAATEIEAHWANSPIRVLVGCAPCQPFSNYTQKRKVNGKWILLYEFSRLIADTKPDIISMENVAQLLAFAKAPIFQDFHDTLDSLGYFIDFRIVNCADYGVPQFRKRLVLLASKRGPISLLEPTHSPDTYVTVRKAIGHLPAIEHGQSCETDFLHRSNRLTPLNYRRILSTREGGGWKDWDESLILKCHKKESGKTYTSVYGRMKWDEPSPTITTHCNGIGNGRFGHPDQHRAISLREAAILQSFPDDYAFVRDRSSLNVRRLSAHLGNAVPVGIGKVIGLSIIEHLKKRIEFIGPLPAE